MAAQARVNVEIVENVEEGLQKGLGRAPSP